MGGVGHALRAVLYVVQYLLCMLLCMLLRMLLRILEAVEGEMHLLEVLE